MGTARMFENSVLREHWIEEGNSSSTKAQTYTRYNGELN
jgi:hypothetical protein